MIVDLELLVNQVFGFLHKIWFFNVKLGFASLARPKAYISGQRKGKHRYTHNISIPAGSRLNVELKLT